MSAGEQVTTEQFSADDDPAGATLTARRQIVEKSGQVSYRAARPGGSAFVASATAQRISVEIRFAQLS
jgi:hypothetical protein